ncbi:MAG: hypothetical protein Pg6A_06090 [Termitinemataceae bacterium]|nr:MAG: hypothetical protein Pg6A_06090 [Termitinemataceae bacterium]
MPFSDMFGLAKDGAFELGSIAVNFFKLNPELLYPFVFGISLLVLIVIIGAALAINKKKTEEHQQAETGAEFYSKQNPCPTPLTEFSAQNPRQESLKEEAGPKNGLCRLTVLEARIGLINVLEDGAESVRVMCDDFFNVFNEAAKKTNGVIEMFSDASVALYWGSSESPAHDALNAARAAFLARAAISEINKIRAVRGEKRIIMLAGISSGYLLQSQINGKHFFAGEAALLAAQAREAAWRSLVDIVLTAKSWRFVKNYLITEELRPLPHIKGTAPIRLFAAVNLRSVPPESQNAPLTVSQLRSRLAVEELWRQ